MQYLRHLGWGGMHGTQHPGSGQPLAGGRGWIDGTSRQVRLAGDFGPWRYGVARSLDQPPPGP